MLQLLFLLAVANGAPILARNMLGDHFGQALDFDLILYDKRRLLGPSKTIRGVIAAVALTGVAGIPFGMSFATGAIFGLCAMVGDLLSSFIKRRFNIKPSDSALGLDQGLEALFPLLFLAAHFELRSTDIVILVVMFFFVEIALSRLLYWMHVRKRPL